MHSRPHKRPLFALVILALAAQACTTTSMRSPRKLAAGELALSAHGGSNTEVGANARVGVGVGDVAASISTFAVGYLWNGRAALDARYYLGESIILGAHGTRWSFEDHLFGTGIQESTFTRVTVGGSFMYRWELESKAISFDRAVRRPSVGLVLELEMMAFNPDGGSSWRILNVLQRGDRYLAFLPAVTMDVPLGDRLSLYGEVGFGESYEGIFSIVPLMTVGVSVALNAPEQPEAAPPSE